MKDKQEQFSTYAGGPPYAAVDDLNKEARIRAAADKSNSDTIKALTDDYIIFKSSGGPGGVSKEYVDTEVSKKQDTLTSGTNIKTINNESIVGSGNIEIKGGSGGSPLDNNIEIYDNESNNFVAYKMD
ncbi:MAG: hypothetical protein REH79_03590, partial [Spiroplasma sp.]|nr:hypothetical protein [Spiroplasma sp.]